MELKIQNDSGERKLAHMPRFTPTLDRACRSLKSGVQYSWTDSNSNPIQENLERGQDLSEYALLVAFIAVVVVAGVTIFGNDLLAAWQNFAAILAGWLS